MRAGECTSVYVMTNGVSTKIGIAKDVMWRRVTLGGNKYNMQVVRSWYLPGRAQEVEMSIRRHFSNQRFPAYTYEWFSAHYDEVCDVVERHINYLRPVPRHTERGILKAAARKKR